MLNINYNPDVLSCLSNLSNDEVFTPPKLVNEMLDLIKEKLEKGEDVLITGLGKFQLRDKKSRPGRDPKSKRDYVISARRVVTFHPSKVWREELNNKI